MSAISDCRTGCKVKVFAFRMGWIVSGFSELEWPRVLNSLEMLIKLNKCQPLLKKCLLIICLTIDAMVN